MTMINKGKNLLVTGDSDLKEESMIEDMPPKSKLLSNLKLIFGYSEFREGQEWAIERCMTGKRSLLVAPTGFGKSLCYALPAALLDGVCVVVSPLISLIQASTLDVKPFGAVVITMRF